MGGTGGTEGEAKGQSLLVLLSVFFRFSTGASVVVENEESPRFITRGCPEVLRTSLPVEGLEGIEGPCGLLTWWSGEETATTGEVGARAGLCGSCGTPCCELRLRRRRLPMKLRFFFSGGGIPGRSMPGLACCCGEAGACVSTTGWAVLRLPLPSAPPSLVSCAVIGPFVVEGSGIPNFRLAASIAFSTSAAAGTIAFDFPLPPSSSSSKSVESPSSCPARLGIPLTALGGGEPASSSSSESANRLRNPPLLDGPSSSSSESAPNRDRNFGLCSIGAAAAAAASFPLLMVGAAGGWLLLNVILPPPPPARAPASTLPLRKLSLNFSPLPRPPNTPPPLGESDRILNAPPPLLAAGPDTGLVGRCSPATDVSSMEPARMERFMVYRFAAAAESAVDCEARRRFLRKLLSESESLVTCCCSLAVNAPEGAGGAGGC